MGKIPLSKKEIKKIRDLRSRGLSINEILKITKRGKATISRYIQGVSVLPEYRQILKSKQGGSIYLAGKKWDLAKIQAKKYINNLSKRDKIIVLVCLYWGEGNKTEFNLVNSDPYLIKTVYEGLIELNVNIDDIKFSLRVFEDMNLIIVKRFWSKILGISSTDFTRVEIIKGKKLGKLKYGMCRIRIRKGQHYFKLIMSMISLIRGQNNAAVVQWIRTRYS